MAQRPLREYDAKMMLARNWKDYFTDTITFPGRFARVAPDTELDDLPRQEAWLTAMPLVVKPDMIIGKRGKQGLLLLNADWQAVRRWLEENRGREVTVGNVTGQLTHFIIEPYVKTDREYYLSINSKAFGEEILFSSEGGVDIEEQMDKGNVRVIKVSILEGIGKVNVAAELPSHLDAAIKDRLEILIRGLYRYCMDLGYAFYEINPFVMKGEQFIPLDLKCRLDDTADFEAGKRWGDITFPAEFGGSLLPEEAFIKSLDEKSGASIKLTILNPEGRIWTMVAGGGASVVYTDTIVDLGYVKELANYGEYSGNPSTDETYQYANTVLDLMTREKNPDGKAKYLLIGGGIANFTDVANTFTGIIKALEGHRQKLQETPVRIYVRRGGPNYKEGLRRMKELGSKLGVLIDVYGPETHMTEIVRIALAKMEEENTSGRT